LLFASVGLDGNKELALSETFFNVLAVDLFFFGQWL